MERYFGAVYLAKHLVRVVRKDDTVSKVYFDFISKFFPRVWKT